MNAPALRHNQLLAALAQARDEEQEKRPVVQKVYSRGTLTPCGRNEKCPCGSGKKWKRCHGRR